MREILFRGKRADNREWVEGYLFDDGMVGSNRLFVGGIVVERYNGIADDDWDVTGIDFYEVDPKTVCQYTGLTGKNGKKIFEGDIIKCVDINSEAEFFAVVEFGNPNGFYSWGYQLRHIWGDEANLDILLWIDMEEAGASCKVIGNIFDNPELIGGQP